MLRLSTKKLALLNRNDLNRLGSCSKADTSHRASCFSRIGGVLRASLHYRLQSFLDRFPTEGGGFEDGIDVLCVLFYLNEEIFFATGNGGSGFFDFTCYLRSFALSLSICFATTSHSCDLV